MKHDGQNIMVILSSPSGVGKTTLTKKIQQKYSSFKISVSHTTRSPRPNEIDGLDYHFVSKQKFENLIKQKKFYEYAKIFENFYGTLKKDVDETIVKNDLIFDIDWQGTQQLAGNDSTGEDLVSIFVLPPDNHELETRLQRRAQDSKEVVRVRMAKASDEMSHYREYNYIIVNHDIEESVGQVQIILGAERLRINRQAGLHDFVQTLRGDD